jgi:nucleoside-diphosphate-sugar epimerase
MRVLVTGATGFIGNHVLNYLTRSTSLEVIATSRNLDSAKKRDWYKKITFIAADLHRYEENWYTYFNSPDIVIHLAWNNLPNYMGDFHVVKNLPNDIIFLSNLMVNGLKNVVVSGTCFEYGMQEGELSEGLPTFPSNAYAIAKDTLRRFLEIKTREFDVNFKWLRLFYTYGDGQSPFSIISQLNQSIELGEKFFNMSGGEQLRDYLPVEKVAEYIVKLSLRNNLSGIFNISSGSPVKLSTFIRDYLKSNSLSQSLNLGYYKYSSYEPMAFWGNNEKIKNL